MPLLKEAVGHLHHKQPTVADILPLLQGCRKKRNLNYANHVANICNNGLESELLVGNYVVPMFVECGSISDAQRAFNRSFYHNEHSWTSLISGYIESGQYQNAFNLYWRMQEDNIHPSGYTLTALLRACAKAKDLERGWRLHFEVKEKGYGKDPFVGNTLVHMYAKCGSLPEAQEVFDHLPSRDVVTWTALISGYSEYGSAQEVLKCFEQMQQDGVHPDAIALACSLKGCGTIASMEQGRRIHTKILDMGFEVDVSVGNTLVGMYAKCGALAEAKEVFDKLPVRDTVSWTALIAGYSEHGYGVEALVCFSQMQQEGIAPDAVTFVCSLKACANIGDIDKGRIVHSQIEEKGLERDLSVANSLIDMYAKCGFPQEAQQVFDKLLVRDVVSWTALIAGYAENGHGFEALKCLEEMQLEGMPPDPVTFICSLKACSSIGCLSKGREIHISIMQKGFVEDIVIGNALVDMYAKCHSFKEAAEVFDNLSVRDVVSWTTLITSYAENGFGLEALKCYEQMQAEGITPNEFTLTCILKACGSLGDIDKGRETHLKISCQEFGKSSYLGSSLVDMYFKCGSLADAQEVFDNLPCRDLVSWNALIAGYAEYGCGQDVLKYFEHMRLEGVVPDAVTYVCVLKGCGSIGAIDNGREIHNEIVQAGFGKDLFVGNALVDMYAKCGLLFEARKVFDALPVHDVVSWNILIASYLEHGLGHEALSCYKRMLLEDISPNAATYVCILKSCCSVGATDRGQEIHTEITKKGLECDPFVGTTLVDMYVKGGLLQKAQEVFDKLPFQDIVAWNAMIRGYGLNHEPNMAIQCFEAMRRSGVMPDAITFKCLLAACSRASLVEKGLEYMKLMVEEYSTTPMSAHYICMVDLLARSGHLHGAEKLLKTASCNPSKEAWTSLLGACKTYAEVELGLRCFEELVEMNPESATPYALLSNIYTSASRWADANRVEELRMHARPYKCFV